ncbi:M14 family zinc carboxypeptidase [candidate division KSB1 bacterium]
MNNMRTVKWLFSIGSFVLISSLSYSAVCQVTPPVEYLGYAPGDDFHLATYEQLIGYFEHIADQSNRINVFDMGPTTGERRMKYAIISSDENMANLEKYRQITQRLSLARDVSPVEAESLANEGKAVVWIDAGIHSTETSPPMHHFQLAYDLVTGEDKQIRFIRDNVILLLVIANPDGMTLVADWYMKNIGTPFERSGLPVLYHKYAGHDNNRDAFMANLVETRNVNRVIGTEWYPELIYTQHETAPFPARIWIPPNPEPVSPNIHPIVTRWKNLIGAAMGQGFDSAGKSGAISRTAFDLWYPGYSDGPSVEGHNIPSVLTETANYRYATPRFYTLDDFPEPYRDLTAGTFFPSPWEGGWWRLKDAVEYNLIASKSVLDVAAKYRYEFLLYKYKMGADVIERFQNEPPYGWIFPVEQPDQTTTALMLNRMIGYGIEVYRSSESFIQDGIPFSVDSYIIPTSQPFGLYAKNILEKQKYPDLRKYSHLWQGISRTATWDGSPLAPYDGVGWTLPVQMGIKTLETASPITVGLTRVSEAVAPIAAIEGSGSHYVFSATDNNSMLTVNRIINAGGTVSRALEEFTVRGRLFPLGSFIVNAESIRESVLQEIIDETYISLFGHRVRVPVRELSKTRIGLYTSWAANMDAGWISYVLDQYGFGYSHVYDAEVKAGNLRNRFDVIILPDQSASSIINGHRKGTMPPNYVGGITPAGVENLKTFVENGGILVCNKMSSDLPIRHFELPVKNILQGVPADSFNCPGSLLRVHYNTGNPLTFGLEENGIAYFSRAGVFEIASDSLGTDQNSNQIRPVEVARFSDKPLLISGWILGEGRINNKTAVLDVPYKKGRVILFGFNVVNRAQAFATFKLLFNAMYYE